MTPIKNLDKYVMNGLDVDVLEELLQCQNELSSIDEEIFDIDQKIIQLQQEKQFLEGKKPTLTQKVQEILWRLYNPAKKMKTIADIMYEEVFISEEVKEIEKTDVKIQWEIVEKVEELKEENQPTLQETDTSYQEEKTLEMNVPKKIDFMKIQPPQHDKKIWINTIIQGKFDTMLNRSTPQDESSDVVTFLTKCRTLNPAESMIRFSQTPFIFDNQR